MTPAKALNQWRLKQALSLVFLLLLVPMTGFINNFDNTPVLEDENISFRSTNAWDSLSQPWGQYSRVPTHNGTMPIHSPSGGPGTGSVANVSTFGVIDSPTVNWVATDDIDGSDTYGSIIGDFSASVTSTPAATERCGEGELFAVIVTSDGGTSKLSIVTGDEAKVAWEVDLGQTQAIRSTPMLTDISTLTEKRKS